MLFRSPGIPQQDGKLLEGEEGRRYRAAVGDALGIHPHSSIISILYKDNATQQCTETATELSHQDSEDSEPDCIITKVENLHEVDQDRQNLLKDGMWPYLEPAQRDWARAEPITLPVNVGGVSMQWPPKGWETMSPDNKLMALETAAYLLCFNETRNPPTLNRAELVQRYNFLRLPGTGEARPDSVEEASRILSRKGLKKIISAESDISMWTSVPRADRWQDVGKELRDKVSQVPLLEEK